MKTGDFHQRQKISNDIFSSSVSTQSAERMDQEKAEIIIKGSTKQVKEFRKFFLLQFTKELLINSGGSEVFKLKNVLKEEAKEEKQKVKEEKKVIKQIIAKKQEPLFVLEKRPPMEKDLFKNFSKPPLKRGPRVLRIPEARLPAKFQYLIPTPTQKEIELGRLNSLIRDPAVRIIECGGPDTNLFVRGAMGGKSTNIILNKEEIKDIIEKFSMASKIPVSEGVFRVVLGRLILSAIVSEVIGSKFIIRKMLYHPMPGAKGQMKPPMQRPSPGRQPQIIPQRKPFMGGR